MKRKGILALAMLVVLAFASVSMATRTYSSKSTKQTGGGSTGDSLTAGPDTSSAMTIPRDATTWWVIAAADSQCRYTVQVSEGGTYWYSVIIDSTGGAGQAEAATAQTAYQGLQLRIILDPVPAGTSPYGAAWLQYSK
jgi:hypothetical protein